MSADNNAIHDLSDGTFTIMAPTLTVDSPNGGETLVPGETYSVTWTPANVTGDVGVWLELNGAYSAWIAEVPASDGQVFWTVPGYVDPGTAYKVHVMSADNNAIDDLSDGDFTITP